MGVSVHLVVGDGAFAVDQPAVVLGVEDGGGDVVPGEGADGVEGGPEAEGDHLGAAVVEVPGEQVGLEVARGRAVLRDAGAADVGDVGVAVLGANPAAPGAGDHGAPLSRSQATAASSPPVSRSRSA